MTTVISRKVDSFLSRVSILTRDIDIENLSVCSVRPSVRLAQDRAIITMADQQKVVHDLSNRDILNHLERPKTHISRSGHSLMLNICEMAKDKAIVSFQMVSFSVTLSDF